VHLQLEALVTDLESAVERLRGMHGSLSHHAWSTRPAPGSWSAAECLAHLTLTSEALLPLFRRAVELARDQGEPAPARYRRGLLGWLAGKIIEPRGRLKIPTTEAFVPVTVRPVDDLVSDFTRLQVEIIACVRSAEGVSLDRVTVRSPFHGRLTYNAYAALTLVSRHQHRHLHQAERAAHACAPLAAPVAI
jgi:hypothetical protein